MRWLLDWRHRGDEDGNEDGECGVGVEKSLQEGGGTYCIFFGDFSV